MNSCHCPLVTGNRPIRKAGTCTTCAGRSLSSENGSSAASTPSTNSPAGTRQESTAPAAIGRRSRTGRRRRPAGTPGGSVPAGTQHRRALAQLERGEHGLVVLLLVLDDHAVGEQVLLVGRAPDASSTRPRTSRQKERACTGGSSGSSGRSARRCLNASYSCSTSGRSRPCTLASPPRSSQRSSCWPMCARSQTSGLISGSCWRTSSGSSRSVRSSVRRAGRARGRGPAAHASQSSSSGGVRGAARRAGAVGQLVTGRPPGGDQLGQLADLGRRARRARARPRPSRQARAAAASPGWASPSRAAAVHSRRTGSARLGGPVGRGRHVGQRHQDGGQRAATSARAPRRGSGPR